MTTQYETLWQSILRELNKSYDESIYQEVFEPINGVHKYQNGLLFIVVPSLHIKNRIHRFYINRINELAEGFANEPVRVKFVTEEDLAKEESESRKAITNIYREGNLNSVYTFDNMVVGKSNMFAFRMAMKVADQPGIVANPFYIFGDVGLGKTHLMHAIGNYILDNDLNKKVLYTKADGFLEDYTGTVRRMRSDDFSTIDDFNEKYRDIDVLLVDDIQILSNANKTQQEFFKLFDYLYLNNKQIVITSDKPASELKNFMPRLTSRFEAGLIVDMQIPDLEHRISILEHKLLSFDDETELSSDVLEFIATHFVTNIREMEGALIRLLNYAKIYNINNITVEVCRDVLEPLLKTKVRSDNLNENNYDKIQSIVSDFYNISLEDLIGKKRHARYTLPRHIAMYIIKEKYDLPYKTIGSLFGDRDHSTVLSACDKISNDIKSNREIKLAYDTITKKINIAKIRW